MEFLIKLVIKLIANFKLMAEDGKFNSKDIDTILAFVIEESQTEKAGWEKAAQVIEAFKANWGGRASWVAQTVVQLVYALAKIRGLNV